MGLVAGIVCGYSLDVEPLAFKVVLMQSSMPVAIWSVVACKIFDLDEDLALGLWVFTTVAMAGLLPFYALLAGI